MLHHRLHLANPGEITWMELAHYVVEHAGFDTRCVVGRPARKLGLVASRPRYSALGSERGILLPNLQHALDRYMSHTPYQRAG
jgi:dTDP-4-dehydrorhamnose reductase